MYSLTKATQELLNHYEMGSLNVSKEIQTYNTHKIRHILGVLEVGRNLIIKIKENSLIDEITIKRAEIVLIHHDLGRFYQNNKDRVLTNKEFEHGDYSSDLAKSLGYDEKVCLAIKYHDKYNLDGLFIDKNYINMSEIDKSETLFLAKIIRDADKLQNMIYITFDIDGLTKLNKSLKKGDISQKVLDDIKQLRPANRENMVSTADDVVGMLGRIFDINFNESLKMLEYYGYTQKIINAISKLDGVSIEKIDELKSIFDNYKKYIK